MTVKDAARQLQISPSLIYALVAAGKLACTRHGLRRGTIRISDQQLADYLAGAARHPQPPPRAFRHLRLPP